MKRSTYFVLDSFLLSGKRSDRFICLIPVCVDTAVPLPHRSFDVYRGLPAGLLRYWCSIPYFEIQVRWLSMWSEAYIGVRSPLQDHQRIAASLTSSELLSLSSQMFDLLVDSKVRCIYIIFLEIPSEVCRISSPSTWLMTLLRRRSCAL